MKDGEMPWETEKGQQYKVPKRILDFVRKGILEDTSWHNDASPSFTALLGGEMRAVLWVEHPNPKKRSFYGKRYAVQLDNERGGRGFPVDVVETDNLNEAIYQMSALAHKYGWR